MSESAAVLDVLTSVDLGIPGTFRNLTVFPLLANEPGEAGYLTLDEALDGGSVQITEIGEAGSVPELSLKNDGPAPVLLLDGEELVGAKQNRVLNLTILVAARSTLTIPVSCVESGRWHHVSRGFPSAARAPFAEGRAAKMRDVTASLRTSGTRRSNQGDVWNRIADKAARLGAESDTGAMAAMFERAQAPIDGFVEAFPPDPRQAGAIFAINGRLVGLELFDAPATWRKLAPKLLRSYAVDAIDKSGEGTDGSLSDEARRFYGVHLEGRCVDAPGNRTGLGRTPFKPRALRRRARC